MQSNCYLYHV